MSYPTMLHLLSFTPPILWEELSEKYTSIFKSQSVYAMQKCVRKIYKLIDASLYEPTFLYKLVSIV